jgi:hypothetical protein
MSELPPPRRRFPRIATHHAVLVRELDGPLEGFARTSSMALGGCSFVSDEPLREGANVELLINVAGRVITARGRCVYDNPVEDGRHEIGVEFTQLAEEDGVAIGQLFETPPATVS